jgi:hypothetical protein
MVYDLVDNDYLRYTVLVRKLKEKFILLFDCLIDE